MRALIDILDSRRLQSPDHLRPLTWSHPFAHRPLVEFMLSVPPAAVYGPGRPRELMRRSLEHLLPPAVASRRSKAGYRDIFRLSLLPMAAQLRESSSLILADEGLIDADHVRARMSRFVRGEECNESQLRHIILLEHWLRRRLQFPEQARHTLPPDSRASAEFRTSLALSGEVRLGKA